MKHLSFSESYWFLTEKSLGIFYGWLKWLKKVCDINLKKKYELLCDRWRRDVMAYLIAVGEAEENIINTNTLVDTHHTLIRKHYSKGE